MRVAVVLQKPTSEAKTRLKGWLSTEERAGLVQVMLSDVLHELTQVPSLDFFGVVTKDPAAMCITEAWGGHVFYENIVRGMNDAIRQVKKFLGPKVQHMLILPADVPLISAVEIDALMRQAEHVSVTIAPCRKMTGTNGLILSPPSVMDTAFGPGSMKRHCQIAFDRGLDYTVSQALSLSHDVDTVEDLYIVDEMGCGTLTNLWIKQSGIFRKNMDIEVTT